MVAVTHTVTGLSGLTGGDLLPDSILPGFDYNVAPNAEGSGSLTLPYGQSLAPLAKGNVIVVRHDGVPVHSWVIDAHREHPIAIGLEAAQLSQVTGLGLAGLLSRYLHRDTLGFDKSPWARTRTWSAFVPQYTGWSSWGFATPYGDTLTPTPYWDGLPDGFPALNVQRVGPSEGDTSSAPQGYWWYLDPAGEVGSITLGARSLCSFFVSADNLASFHVGGFTLGRIDPGADYMKGFRTTTRFDVVLDAGTHPVGFKVVNVPFGGGDPGYGEGPELSGNPTFALGVGFTSDGAGRFLERIWETSSAGRLLAYPDDPPGMTLPEIVEAIIEENWLDGILPLFDVETNGSFPELESVTEDCNLTLLEMLRDQWAPGGLCDWHVPPTQLKVQLWPSGTRGTAQDVTYEVNSASPMESSLLDLSIYSIDEDTDCLRVGWQGGSIRVPASGGSRMAGINTDAETPGEARIIGEAVLSGDAQPEQYSALIAPVGDNDVPGVDFDCGDSIAIAGSRETVVGWGGRLDVGASIVGHSVIVKNRILDEEERLDEVVRRAAPGQKADAPTSPASAPPELGTSVRSAPLKFSLQRADGSTTYPAGLVPIVERSTIGTNVYGFDIEVTELPSGSVSIRLWIDGFPAGDGTLSSPDLVVTVPTSGDHGWWLTGGITPVQVEILSAAAVVDGLQVTARTA